jgi:hypothetical protein
MYTRIFYWMYVHPEGARPASDAFRVLNFNAGATFDSNFLGPGQNPALGVVNLRLLDIQGQRQMIFALRTNKITLMFLNAMNSGGTIGALRLGIEPYETQTSIMIRNSPGYVYNSALDLIDVKVERVWARLKAPNSIPKDWGVIDPLVDVVQISFGHSKQNAYGDVVLGDDPDALDQDQ